MAVTIKSPPPVTALARENDHLGVLGMRERVEMVGGTFKSDSTPGKGTLVSAEIPFSYGAPAEARK